MAGEETAEELEIQEEGESLDMSDEDFLKLGENPFEQPDEKVDDDPEEEEEADDEEEAEDEDDESDDSDEESEEGDEPDEDDSEEEADDGEEDEESDSDDSEDDEDSETEDESDSEGEDEVSENDEETEDASKEKDSEESELDYKAEYEKLTAPFKANGREMKIDNVDDAIRLMQMGANYNRKMAAMKPQLKVLKMLQKNELLDEGKLNFLIDLDQGNPAAITKFLKDKKVDPMELDLEKDPEYEATNRTVADSEVDLDMVLDELKDSPTYNKTLDVVGNKWDDASKQIVAQTPQLLRVINDHMASGIYDLISTEVEKQRMFGNLDGKSDIDAYKETGDRLHAEGAFDHLAPAPNKGEQPGETKKPTQQVKKPKPKVSDQKRLERRRKAAPRKTTAKKTSTDDFNPLNMSDEEYSKQFDSKFL